VPDLFQLLANVAGLLVTCRGVNPPIKPVLVQHIQAGLRPILIVLLTLWGFRTSGLLALARLTLFC
jgi:hypothetical protein